MFVTWDSADVERVFSLRAQGCSLEEVCLLSGVPRTTAKTWLSGRMPRRRLAQRFDPGQLPFRSYAYVLGLYLGDGHLVRQRRDVYRLCLVNDAAYPRLVSEAVAAIQDLLPLNLCRARAHSRHSAILITSYSKTWSWLLPQHGPGPKHMRRIALDPWQRKITAAEPGAFVRGLIHSDGCRYIARQRCKNGLVYAYVRYMLVNASEDIRSLFCEHLDLLGVQWTQSSERRIQIARRDAVDILEAIVGPKM